MRRTWAAVVAAALLYFLTGPLAEGLTGLTRSVVSNSPSHNVFAIGRVETITLDDLEANAGGPDGVTVVWEGFWEVPDGAYDLRLDSNGRSTWTIDDTVVIQTLGEVVDRTVWLAAGFHRIEIRYDVDSGQPRLVVAAARAGQTLMDLPATALKPRLPRNPTLRAATRALHTMVGWVTLLALAWAIRTTIRELPDKWRRPLLGTSGGGINLRSVWIRRALAWTVLAGILVHGALLRIDAITGRFGVVSSPQWLGALQERSTLSPTAIRSPWVVWEPEPLFPHVDGPPTHYRSDPYTYLDAARKMTTFYMPHFREPVFPFVTRLALGALDDQDVAVSFASTAFSLVAIWLTYVLGAAVWSRPVGLFAALGLALDYNVISLASLGWRDDAYMAAFTMCAYLLLRYWRASRASVPRVHRVGRWDVSPVYVEAAVLGVGAGLTILTRVMAISFLVAGLGWMILVGRKAWRQQVLGATIVTVVAVVIAAPYFIACWRAFGDPFLTFNVHAPIYSAAEGQAGFQGSTASYIRDKIEQRPREAVDTVMRGVTSYPFMNKWQGLDRWQWGIGNWAMIAGLAGLVAFAGLPWGRLLLVTTVTSLVPFALTWTVDPDYRFTVFVYPVLLVAAAVACGVALEVLRVFLTSRPAGVDTPWRGFAWRPFLATTGTALAVLWFVTRLSPSLVLAEALKAGEDVSVTAGARDGPSFRRGWTELVGTGNVRSRVATHEAELRVHLPEQRDYRATVRMDPFPLPPGNDALRLPRVDVIFNGVSIATIDLSWTPGRVGSYPIVFPQAAVRRGANRLVFRVVPSASLPLDSFPPPRPGLTEGYALGLWYVRVHPAQ